ncbi:MAG: DUF4097 domain-containing protein [Clostridia bacterium]|nr:DUF4097 domain-containing protein [Clostridia bacterium]
MFIPETYGGQFYINLPYGEVNIGNFKYSSISLMSDAGDVSIEEAENISANLSYGDLEIGKARTIYALCNTGDIEIGEVDSFCNLEVELGNIEIENCNIDSESDLHIDCGDIKIDKTSDVNIEASTSFGDTRVAHSNASSPVKLTAIVDAGDIKIN